MSTLRTLSSLVVLAAMMPALKAQPQRPPPAPAFSVERFEASVKQQMHGLAKGWAIVVADRHDVRVRAAGGWAQSPGDGDIVMTTTTLSGTGSVFKMVTGTALLYLFEQRKLAPQSVDVQLDKPMLAMLPPKWQSAWPTARLERVTYRHLLQHQSGFRGSNCGSPDLTVLQQLAGGVARDDVGRLDCYNNFNYYLLRYIIPAIAYPQEFAQLDARLRQRSMEDYTEDFNWVSANLMERFLTREFFPKSVAALDFTCRPYQLPAKRWAKSYANADADKGQLLMTEQQHKDKGNYCASQGGWYVSAEGLAQFGRTMMLSDRWLSATTRNRTFEPAKYKEAYPWAGTVQQPELAKTFGQTHFAYHGGSERSYRAALVLLPGGHIGAGVTNSPMDAVEPKEDRNTSLRLAQVIADAFADATRGQGGAVAIPRETTGAASQSRP